MTRKEHLEELAKVWESLGDGRMANETWLGEDGDHDELVTQFQHKGQLVDFYHYAPGGKFDTWDATPCLALLRDVKGEDWTITEGLNLDGKFWAVDRNEEPDATYRLVTSHTSRIDALTKALEAK